MSGKRGDEVMDLIDRLAPNHDKVTCSDLDPCNEHRCFRCHLIALAADDLTESYTYTCCWERQ